MKIDSGTVDLLIWRTQNDQDFHWEKHSDHCYKAKHGQYWVTLKLDGPIPELIFVKNDAGDDPPPWMTEQVTDKSRRDGFFKKSEDGGVVSNYWIATLANIATNGEVSLEQTIKATNQEFKKLGWL